MSLFCKLFGLLELVFENISTTNVTNKTYIYIFTIVNVFFIHCGIQQCSVYHVQRNSKSCLHQSFSYCARVILPRLFAKEFQVLLWF